MLFLPIPVRLHTFLSEYANAFSVESSFSPKIVCAIFVRGFWLQKVLLEHKCVLKWIFLWLCRLIETNFFNETSTALTLDFWRISHLSSSALRIRFLWITGCDCSCWVPHNNWPLLLICTSPTAKHRYNRMHGIWFEPFGDRISSCFTLIGSLIECCFGWSENK